MNPDLSDEMAKPFHRYQDKIPTGILDLFGLSKEGLKLSFEIDTELSVNISQDIQYATKPGIKPFGYWLNNRWYSLIYDMKNWTSFKINECLTGYDVIMLGDSTMSQWIDALDTRISWTYQHSRMGHSYKCEQRTRSI